jgi:acetyl-CoA carboxylase alpha subunit/acetyl-CoA carboxylase beta subunit
VLERDELSARDPLRYLGYKDALARARTASGADESVRAGRATVAGHEVELALFEFAFMGGSQGEVAGERLARALERAARRGVPMVTHITSGGARLQEGMCALSQLPKVVAARMELADAHQALVAILASPTTGGALVSLGALADVAIAEERATIGFAGPRIVQRFTGRPLDRETHTAESAHAHGLVDATVPRRGARGHVGRVLSTLRPDAPTGGETPADASSVPEPDPWDAVQAVRSPARLAGWALLEATCEQSLTLRGDRSGGDDPALIAALARVEGRRALLLVLDRAHAPGPRAYRKAQRTITIAERLGLPIVTLIDTAGADPSEGSEAGGIAWRIAETMQAMLAATVPTLALVVGEGGSGGALALAVADTLVAFSDATFSVIGPEAAAEILWRDPRRAPDAARALKLTAHELLRLGIADALVGGPPTAAALRATVSHHLAHLTESELAGPERAARRRARWRRRA